MKVNNIDNFLILCKKNYQEKITPANPSSYSKTGYLELKDIALEYFNNGGYEEFADLLKEGQYFVSLWAAHLLLEFGNPSRAILLRALCTIIEYSESPLAVDVAEQEKIWLNNIDINIPKAK